MRRGGEEAIARDSLSNASVGRASVTSSVNGLIQQSFDWLDGVDADNRRRQSLAPPNPAFASSRSLSNNHRSASSSSLPSSPPAPALIASSSNASGLQLLPYLSPSASSGTIITATSQFPSPPPRSASISSNNSNNMMSNPQYSPVPTTVYHPHPPRSTSSTPTLDQSQIQANNNDMRVHANNHNMSSYSDNNCPVPSPPLPQSPRIAYTNEYSQSSQLPQHHHNSAYASHPSSHPSSAPSPPPSFPPPSPYPVPLYDSPHSPALPSSPHFPPNATSSSSSSSPATRNGSFSNNSDLPRNSTAAYGVLAAAALGGSDFGMPRSSTASYAAYQGEYAPVPSTARPHPSRSASLANSEHNQNNNNSLSSYPMQQRSASASASGSGSGSSARLALAGNAGAAGNYQQLHSPQSRSFSSPSPTAYSPPATSYTSSSYLQQNAGYPSAHHARAGSNQGGNTYTHVNATESTIWGAGEQYDEKVFYGAGMAASSSALALAGGGGNGNAASELDGKGGDKGWRDSLKANATVGKKGRKKWYIIGAIAVVAIGAVVVGVVVALKQNSKESAGNNSASENATPNEGKTTTPPTSGSDSDANDTGKTSTANEWATGSDGSTVTMEDGSTFTYQNQFGGYWVSEPFNDSAQAQSYSPPLNQPWDYSSDKIYGVNIGGWLHLEPFIAPSFFEEFADSADPAVDEWSLSVNLGDRLHDTLVNHYETFITEQDFAQIAGAGLNWVRIALPFWAIEVYPGEPFLEGVCWQYFLKAITWARKYGLRINLDLHTIPGSQNGWNHSGKMGSIGFLNGAMGMANAQRTINYIRILTEIINQPEYRNVVPMFGIINEAQANVITPEIIRAFYLQVYDMMREITGVGEGNGPVISLHDGFLGDLASWNGYLGGSDRIMMDSHPYIAFDEPNDDSMALQIGKPCDKWGPMFNLSMANVGFTYAGEFSLGINDCGQYLNGVLDGRRYDGTYTRGGFTNVTGSCDPYMDASAWSADFKSQLRDFALVSMDTFQNWFFWTWKIGESTVYNRVATPLWSYSLGLQEGYVPEDPRAYRGACVAMAEKYGNPEPSSEPFDGSLQPWMTGGAGAGTIVPTQIASYSQWPPVSLANIPLVESLDVTELPTYTATATALTLTASPTPTDGMRSATPVLNSPYYTPIRGCANYLDPWGAAAATPTGVC